MKKPEYKQLKLKAKKDYSKIGRISSPALNNEYVAFTNKGFTHLIRKGRNPRPRSEQAKRFLLIPYAEQIIKNPNLVLWEIIRKGGLRATKNPPKGTF